ncbi:N-acetyltransferase [Lactobacillus sp. CC-MHH1034]|uniref:GNAT family N-acetyltransferase n=1 Tax=Agrilactobacillus fermenti TaxID=2586909 RepID=UPI001E319647|nr:GNAT family N-acetyltransferase [Agrilactobacillus fermenti]MCD2255415.1 N-acetyltransferase [Agrilactobacillus fermenti]
MNFDYEPGRYFKTDDNGNLLAEVTFQEFADGAAYAINHTFVRDDQRGQGIASHLVAAVVAKAKAEDKKILPLCSYARAQFDKGPDYQAIEFKN